MKSASKVACLLLLVAFGRSSFGMMRMLTRKTSPSRQYQRLSPQQRMIHTTAVSQAAQTPPSFYARMQQAIRNAWTNFTNRFSKAPAVAIPKSIYPKSTEPFSVPLSASIGQSELSASVTASTIQTLQAQALESALKVIKENREEFDLKNGMDGLIVCGYPGPELLVLSKIKSSKNLEQFFINKRKQILKSINFSDEAIVFLMSEIEKNRKNVLTDFYTQPIATTKRDPSLPKKIVEPADEILKKSGINPACVSLVKPTFIEDLLKSRDGTIASASGAYRDGETIQPAILKFYFKAVTFETKNLTEFLIAHEVGHLIRNHTGEVESLYFTLKQQSQNYAITMQKNNPFIDIDTTSDYIFKNVQKEFAALYELEADSTVAILNREIAQSLWQKLLKEIDNLSTKQQSKPSSPIHSSIEYKQELIQKILQLQALERLQEKTHFFEVTDQTKE